MVEVAQATVTIIPTMQGAQQSITDQLTDAAGGAGTTAGKTMGTNLGKSASSSANFSKVGTSLTKGVTLPLVAVGTASVAAFKEVDAGMDIVTKKTGASGDALEAMQKSARNIATSIPTDFNTAGSAIGEVNTRFGVTGQTLEDLSTKYVKFARLNDQDVSSAVDSSSKALAAFGLGADDAGGYLDVLNKVGQDTGVDVGKLSDQVSANAAQFKSMGMNINQATAFLGQCDKAGLDSSAMLTGMKTAMKNAAKEGKTLDEAMADFSGTMNSNKSETEKLQAAYELFGTRAGAAIYNACSTGEIDLANLTGSLGEFEGSVDQTFANVVSPTEDFTTALNSLKDAGAQLGSALMTTLSPIIKEVAGALKSFSEWFSGLPGPMQQTIVKVGLFAAACGPVLSVVGKIGTGIGTLKTAFSGLSGILGKLTGTVSSTSTSLSTAVSGGGGFAALKSWLSQDMSTACSTFQGTLSTIGAAIGTFTASYSLTTWVLEQTGAMESLCSWATTTKLNLFDFAGGNSGGWDERYEAACQKVEAASAGLYQLTGTDIQELETIQQHYSEQSTKWYNINKSESEARAGAMQSYTGLAMTLMSQEGTAAETLAQKHSEAATSMQMSFSKETTDSTNARTSITTDHTEIATSASNTAISFSKSSQQVGTDSGTMASTVKTNMTATKNSITTNMTAAESTAKTKSNAIKSDVDKGMTSASSAAEKGFGKISSSATSNMNAAESEVSAAASNMKGAFGDQNWSSVGASAMEGIRGGISSMISSLAQAAANAASAMLGAAKSALGIASPSKEFKKQIGAFIPPGIAEGIETEMPIAVNAAQTSVDSMVDDIRIPSPADFASFGSSIMSMFGDGMTFDGNVVAAAGAGGDIVIPVYIGQEHIQDMVVTAQQIHNYRSGGR